MLNAALLWGFYEVCNIVEVAGLANGLPKDWAVDV